MQASQILTIPKIRIVVFASGWKKTQEYDNKLVTQLVQDGYKIDVFSYDSNKVESVQSAKTVKPNSNVKRIERNLLDPTTAQALIKELNDNANQYEHTVYIDGFGSDDGGRFHELYKDILIAEKGRTCLNWCTCCQAPQKYSEEPTRTPSNCDVLYPYRNGLITYDYENNTYQHMVMSGGELVKNTLSEEGDITDEQREHVNKNIANKKHNADFSPELVKEICGKVKQQEKQNFSQLDMSKNIGEQRQRNIPAIDHREHDLYHKTFGISFKEHFKQTAQQQGGKYL